MVLFAAYLILLIAVVIFKLPFYSGKLTDIRVVNLIPFKGSFDENGNFLIREIFFNILLFVPLGVYLSLLKTNWSFKIKTISVMCLSLLLEIIQFVFAIGRSDVTDVLSNTLGGIIGIAFCAVLGRAFKNKATKIIRCLIIISTICALICFSYLFCLSHFSMMSPTA